MNKFNKSQELNKWREMIGNIYDGTQNYSKSSFEIHSHLTEVTGAFGKMLFKKEDYELAIQFLPKMFVWAVTLFRKVKGQNSDLQEAILIKFPRVCSYCLEEPCICWNNVKPEIQSQKAKELYLRNYAVQNKSINGIQLMFRKIYGNSWKIENQTLEDKSIIVNILKTMYIRLVEELSEVAEAIRFKHLYPSNFDNELADYFAWWFAIVTNFNRLYNDDRALISAEDLIWNSYPNYCLSCGLQPCDCRPAPVRELLSKPSLNNLALIDGLTQAENVTSFNELLEDIKHKNYPIVLPITCVRIDVDNFKLFNNEISHITGDSALKLLVTVLRQKVRSRDRIFRVGGDEFAVICQDLSSLETEGMMRRFADFLKSKPIKGKNNRGEIIEKVMTLSIGISTCFDSTLIQDNFEFADLAAIESKENGKDRISTN